MPLDYSFFMWTWYQQCGIKSFFDHLSIRSPWRLFLVRANWRRSLRPACTSNAGCWLFCLFVLWEVDSLAKEDGEMLRGKHWFLFLYFRNNQSWIKTYIYTLIDLMYFYGKGRIRENAHGGQSVSRNPGLVGECRRWFLSTAIWCAEWFPDSFTELSCSCGLWQQGTSSLLLVNFLNAPHPTLM